MSRPDKQYPQFGGKICTGICQPTLFVPCKIRTERSSRKSASEKQIMSKDRCPCAFLRQLEAIVLLFSKYFAKRVKKYIYEQLTVCCLAWFPVRLYEQNNVYLSCNSHKKLSRIEWNFKERHCNGREVSKLGNITWVISSDTLSFSWRIFGHVRARTKIFDWSWYWILTELQSGNVISNASHQHCAEYSF